MYVKRFARRYRSEIRIISTLTVICLLFGIYSLLRNHIKTQVEGSTLSSNVSVLPTSEPPTQTPVPSLVVPTNIQINIYINNTTPIYNQIYSQVLTQMPTIISTPVPTSTTYPTSTPTKTPNSTNTPIPTSTSIPAQLPLLSSFTGKYFNNLNLAGTPNFTRIDNIIDFKWGLGSPSNNINNDSFSVIWEAKINSDGGIYQISVNHDDGMRIFIDDTLVHNHWIDKPPSNESFDISLNSGEHNLRIEYYEHLNGATAYFNIEKL